MSTFVRLGEAARQLGVSVDTVRRYIEDGRLPSFRTPGGQTQVRAEDVVALRGLGAVAPKRRPRSRSIEGAAEEEPAARAPQGHRDSSHPSWKDLPPWEQRRAEFKAELEIEQIRHERDLLEEKSNRRAAEDLAEAEEDQRLSKLKRYGKQWCWDLTLQPVVIRKLERFVTSDRIPPWLSESEQRSLVQQFVMGLVNRHLERKREKTTRSIADVFRRGRGDD